MKHNSSPLQVVLFIGAGALIALGLVAPGSPVLAAEDEVTLDDVVVTATRTPTLRKRLGSSISVITAEDIEKQQLPTVAEILRRIPGVNVQANGPPGTSSVIKFRGLEEEHTLVLINGVRQNDPGNARNTFNFEHLLATNIERIEVIRGPQATLYGSRANGAVINIITKRATEPISGHVKGEIGSRNSRLGEFSVESAGTLPDDWGYDVALYGSGYSTSGFSAANENRVPPGFPRPTEDDGSETFTVGMNGGLRPTPESELRFSFDHTTLNAATDRSTSRRAVDANRTKDKRVNSLSLQGRYDAFDGFLENEVTLSRTSTEVLRIYDLEFNNGSRSWYRAAEYKGILNFTEDHILSFGLGYDNERFSRLSGGTATNPLEDLDLKKDHTNYFIQSQNGFFDRLYLTTGVSFDHFEGVHEGAFDGEVTYRAGASFVIDETDTILKASYATGFAAPTLFQLFRFPNATPLEPEKTQLWDAGFEQQFWNNRVRIGATYFRNLIEDQIVFVSTTDGYTNRDEMRSRGVESTLDILAYDADGYRVDLSANHTFITAVDQDSIEVDRVPRHSLNFAIDVGFLNGKGNVRLDGEWESNHKDFYDTSGGQDGLVRLGRHWRFDIAAQYQLTDWVRVHGRIENIFDADYESAAGFASTPFGVFGGLTVTY